MALAQAAGGVERVHRIRLPACKSDQHAQQDGSADLHRQPAAHLPHPLADCPLVSSRRPGQQARDLRWLGGRVHGQGGGRRLHPESRKHLLLYQLASALVGGARGAVAGCSLLRGFPMSRRVEGLCLHVQSAESLQRDSLARAPRSLHGRCTRQSSLEVEGGSGRAEEPECPLVQTGGWGGGDESAGSSTARDAASASASHRLAGRGDPFLLLPHPSRDLGKSPVGRAAGS
mmetsp:Transcript_7285/g.25068  ORF Transcript_7285/g.25068 Transcript_7285/m.25068 type:complete len:231 (+) Transcript_7285:1011-1703(+)